MGSVLAWIDLATLSDAEVFLFARVAVLDPEMPDELRNRIEAILASEDNVDRLANS